uniref:ATP synthase F0 subunit 8 n=1 Tax=Spinibdella lignicola TaxID=2872682 RepID=A0A977S5Z7_9ACAR|nr:ATP synthase F0 subunit 8 [Spinibdella lignicola]UXN44116.1 ATP synthase F0 subunit 8 [Spinibdella lignicola]
MPQVSPINWILLIFMLAIMLYISISLSKNFKFSMNETFLSIRFIKNKWMW